MARPLFGRAAAGTEAEADPEDLAVGGASSNLRYLNRQIGLDGHKNSAAVFKP